MLKNISKVVIGSAGSLAISTFAIPYFLHNSALAVDASCAGTPETCTASTIFKVAVKESLAVSVTTPDNDHWAYGNANEFLRNKINVAVSSNNALGFKASMYATNTNLTNTVNTSHTIPTLSDNTTKSNFPSNHWGYSINNNQAGDGDTEAGSDSSVYRIIKDSSDPITIMSSDSAASDSKDIYFGAKADLTQTAGTYVSTIVINVVTGTIHEVEDDDDNPTVPTDPARPISDNTVAYNEAPTGVGASTTDGTLPSAGGTRYSGTTTYTSISSDVSEGTTTTTSEISGDDNTSSYAPAQGVTDIVEPSNNSALSSALSAAAVAAAASGAFLIIIAKRREDDEEDDNEE